MMHSSNLTMRRNSYYGKLCPAVNGLPPKTSQGECGLIWEVEEERYLSGFGTLPFEEPSCGNDTAII
jgi:hypothetical protein